MPTASLASPGFKEVAQTAWDTWKATGRITFSALQKTPAFKVMEKEYPSSFDIVQELLKRMVLDLRALPTHNYLVHNGRIGYQEHDGVTLKASFGFKTMFAHFQEFDQGKISKTVLEEAVTMRMKCCGYSYAEIPKLYAFTMGVTGTLTSLSPEETKVLEGTFKLKSRTIIPSVYGMQRLTFHEEDDR